MSITAAPAVPVETSTIADPPIMPPLPRASREERPDSHVLALEELLVYGLERAAALGTALLLTATLASSALTHVPEVAAGVG